MRISATPFEFEVFTAAPGDRERLRAIWAAVLRRIENPAYYHFFEWYESYVELLEPSPAAVRFVAAFREGRPVGVFPVRSGEQRLCGLSVPILEIPSSPLMWLGDFVFPIEAANSGIVRYLIEFLRRDHSIRWDVLRIANLLDGATALFSIGSERLPRTIEEAEAGCHYVDCRLYRPSSKLNNKRNRLSRLGPVEYVHVTDQADISGAVEEFIAVEASGWKAAESTAIQCRPQEASFYRTVAARFAALGAAQVSLLRVGGKCIAGFYMLRTGKTLYWLKHGFDEEFAKSSPSLLLFADLVRDCLARGNADRINFITNSAWHAVLSPLELRKRTTLIFRATPRGWAAYVALRVKGALRWLRDKWRIRASLPAHAGAENAMPVAD